MTSTTIKQITDNLLKEIQKKDEDNLKLLDSLYLEIKQLKTKIQNDAKYTAMGIKYQHKIKTIEEEDFKENQVDYEEEVEDEEEVEEVVEKNHAVEICLACMTAKSRCICKNKIMSSNDKILLEIQNGEAERMEKNRKYKEENKEKLEKQKIENEKIKIHNKEVAIYHTNQHATLEFTKGGLYEYTGKNNIIDIYECIYRRNSSVKFKNKSGEIYSKRIKSIKDKEYIQFGDKTRILTSEFIEFKKGYDYELDYMN